MYLLTPRVNFTIASFSDKYIQGLDNLPQN